MNRVGDVLELQPMWHGHQRTPEARAKAGLARGQLAAYVPRLLLERLDEDPAMPSAADLVDASGALLHVDVAGFSALSARLAERSPDGAERLNLVLEGCFERIVAAVHANGGDVLNFSGDGLLALWRAHERDPFRRPVHAAALAALAVREGLRGYEPVRNVEVKLRMGLSAGDLVVARIGGLLGRWETLPAGTPLVHLRESASKARRGDIVVSQQAWRYLKTHYTAEDVGGGYRRLGRLHDGAVPPDSSVPMGVRVRPEMEASLRAFIPAAVQSRMGADGELLAELRRVSVLFIRLPLLDHETPLERGQEVMRAVQRVVYRHQGSLNKIAIDDKGSNALAAMGLPPLPHADDPARALGAALDLHALLRSMGVASEIGVATGRVYCGVVGARARREYTMIGEAVNRAARLMEAAQGGVLCDDATRRAAREAIDFSVVEEHHVRGLGPDDAVYRPRYGPPTARRSQTGGRVIGRDAESKRLRARLRALSSGAGGVVVVRGEAGIGKTWLVQGLIAQAHRRRVEVLNGGGSPIERHAAYLAWRPVFHRLFDLDASEHAQAARTQHVLDRIGFDPWARDHAPLLRAVLPIDVPENEHTKQLEGEARARATQELLAWLLEREASTSPLLLVLEDAHWLDSASWELARRVACDDASVLLIVVTRPVTGRRKRELVSFVEENAAWRIDLERLSPSASTELIRVRLGARSVPRSVSALIEGRAAGHPLFSEELALMLLDDGVLSVREGACVLHEQGLEPSHVTPDTVEGAITARIDRLSSSEQHLLRVASVIGQAFDLRLLEALMPQATRAVDWRTDLARLEELDVLRRESDSPAETYGFKHVIMRDVTYNLMLFSQRSSLHGRVATWIDRHRQTTEHQPLGLLAHHWQHGGDAPRALSCLEAAAEQAIQTFANEEARDLVASALQIANREPRLLNEARRARLHRIAASAQMAIGDLHGAEENLCSTLALIGHATPGTDRHMVGALLVELVRQAFHLGLPWLRRRRRGGDEVAIEAARAYEHWAEIQYHGNRPIACLFGILKTLNLSERIEPAPVLARAYANASIGASFIPLHSLARVYHGRARKTARRLGHDATLARVLSRTAICADGVADWALAEAANQEATEIARRLGDRRQLGECRTDRAQCGYFRNRYALVERVSREVFALRAPDGDVQHQLWGHQWRGHALLRMGKHAEAIAVFDEALMLVRERSDVDNFAFVLRGAKALALLREGRSSDARALADEILVALGRAAPFARSTIEGYAGPVEVYLRLWEACADAECVAELRERTRSGMSYLRQFARKIPIGQPRAWLLRGTEHWLLGQPRRAHRAWQRAIEIAREMDMPFECAQALYERGRNLDADDPRRARYLAEAVEHYDSIGAEWDAERARRAQRAMDSNT